MRHMWFWCVVSLIVLLPVTSAHATLKLHPWRLCGEANGTDTVKLDATVTDANGAPLEGVTVHFQTSAGSITPSEAVTPWYGIVEATLTAPATPQTVTVTATSSAGSDTYNIQFVAPGSLVEFDPPTEGPGVFLDSTPTAIPADGTSSLELIALVLDAEDNPVPNVPVTFRVSNGTLVSNQAITDDKGEAKTTLISSTTPGEVDVYAYAMGYSTEWVVIFVEAGSSCSPSSKTTLVKGRSTSTLGKVDTAVALTSTATQPGQPSAQAISIILTAMDGIRPPWEGYREGTRKNPKCYVDLTRRLSLPRRDQAIP